MSAPTEKRVLSYNERQLIARRMRILEGRLNGALDVPTNPGAGVEGLSDRQKGRYEQFMRRDIHEDRALIKAQLARDRTIMEEGRAKDLSKKERLLVEKRADEQRRWLQERMCPKRIFSVSAKHEDYERAVKACMNEHDPVFKKVAFEYKNNMRTLDPDSPEKSNLESIRPQ